MQSLRVRHSERARAEVPGEKAPEMAAGDAESVGQPLDVSIV